MIAKILRMGETEGMTTSELSRLLNVTPQNIRNICFRHKITYNTLSVESHLYLREHGVVPRMGRRSNFLSRQNIKDLVFYIGTPECKAVYDHFKG